MWPYQLNVFQQVVCPCWTDDWETSHMGCGGVGGSWQYRSTNKQRKHVQIRGTKVPVSEVYVHLCHWHLNSEPHKCFFLCAKFDIAMMWRVVNCADTEEKRYCVFNFSSHFSLRRGNPITFPPSVIWSSLYITNLQMHLLTGETVKC